MQQFSVLLGVVTFVAVIYSILQTRNVMRAQLEQNATSMLTFLSNQHNWQIFDHWPKLPPAMPSWRGLDSDQKWAWRVLTFNHLNLLLLAYKTYKQGLMGEAELDSWIEKSRFWFRDICADLPDVKEGREILRQVLRKEEGYSKEFCDWMLESRIVTPELFH